MHGTPHLLAAYLRFYNKYRIFDKCILADMKCIRNRGFHFSFLQKEGREAVQVPYRTGQRVCIEMSIYVFMDIWIKAWYDEAKAWMTAWGSRSNPGILCILRRLRIMDLHPPGNPAEKTCRLCGRNNWELWR